MRVVETIISITFLASVCSPSARAQIMAVESTYSPGQTYYSIPINSTYGWQFRVQETPITVTHLGYFDRGVDGLIDSHAIGIWDTSGNPIAQGTVSAGTEGILSGAYRFTLITPALLQPNTTYFIGAHSPQPNDEGIFFALPQTYAEQISYLGATYSQLSGFAPADTLYNANHGVFGPNFQFTAVPEPHEVALATAIGLAAFACIRKASARRSARLNRAL